MEFEDYDFEIERLKREIASKKPRTLLLQLPEGLKPFATKIADELKTKDTRVIIWADTCFGACDIPDVKVDMLIQFGHNFFRK